MPLGFAASASGVPVGPQVCAPPPWFRGVEGVRDAWLDSSGGPFGRTPARLKGTGAQRNGKRYERKALAYLRRALGEGFISSPWFRYEDGQSTLHWCQPDGILRIPPLTIAFEVKYSFTSAAWWQLRRLYEPILRVAYRGPVGVVVVCKSFDPAVPFPEEYILCPLASTLLSRKEWDRTLVHVWRP